VQQQELLTLAQNQGVVYEHQLPPTNNGATLDLQRRLLARLLSGQVDSLESFIPGDIDFRDVELDSIQREAVAKALHTPDICLVQGQPGTGKSRIAAEIILQAALRGQRVLLLAPSAAAIDRVLSLIAPSDSVFALRCLDSTESLDSLAAHARALTLPVRLQALHAQAVQRANEEGAAADERSARLRQNEPVWETLAGIAAQQARLQDEVESIEAGRRQIQETVERSTTSPSQESADEFMAAFATCERDRQQALSQMDQKLAELNGQLEDCRKQQEQVHSAMSAVQPVVAAKNSGRWWSVSWWRATFRHNLANDWLELLSKAERTEAELVELQGRIHLLQKQCENAQQQWHEEKLLLISAEVQCRSAAFDRRLNELHEQWEGLRKAWQVEEGRLHHEGPRPAQITETAVRAAQEEWRRELATAEERQDWARQWALCLNQNKTTFAACLPAYANVVAATTSALGKDAIFGDLVAKNAPETQTFDLLVLDEADQVTESEFLNVARRARRWVLIGEPAWQHDLSQPGDSISGVRSLHQLSTLKAPYAFERLWRHLHCDPRLLPHAWTRENGRLCCRLRPISSEERTRLESEQVADFPEVELRILRQAASQSTLAEIIFPPTMAIEDAKQYIYRELQELTVRPTYHSLRWVEKADRLVLRLSGGECAHDISVGLDHGILERMGNWSEIAEACGSSNTPWQTCCLEFDLAAGWHRRRAEEWIQQHSGLRDLGRTVRLDVLHRMNSNLAVFLSGCLSEPQEETYVEPRADSFSQAIGSHSVVQFVSVPSLNVNENDRGRNGNHSKRQGPVAPNTALWPRKGGAGLELDLNDPRNRERLPIDVRFRLPNYGFVNYLEAQALVRKLAAMASELAAGPTRPRVAVLALYVAQAELIRHLIQETVPSAREFDLEIGVPASFRQREADVILLSLTRSHTHRPVAYGESPRILMLALTRARSRLIILGDPGTLMRRSQWEGPLEHLNEEAARQERSLIARLVQQLQERDADPQVAPQVCQESGS